MSDAGEDRSRDHGAAARVWVTDAGADEVFLVAASKSHADSQQAAAASYAEIAATLHARGLQVVHERVFASCRVEPLVLAARAEALRSRGISVETPITFIEGCPPWGEGFAGVVVRAVRAVGPEDVVWTILDGTVPVGRGWRRQGRTQLVLQAIDGLGTAEGPAGTLRDQTTRMIERAERLLQTQGAAYGDVVRTWFYLVDILGWYDTFNEGRTAEYARLGLLPVGDVRRLRLPASTGIGGCSPRGGAGTLDLLAMRDEGDRHSLVQQMSSSAQKDAYEYGSAFSRGAVIRTQDRVMIQVSGTAAIDESGRSLHDGDAAAQVQCTLDKISALLRPVQASLRDVCASVVFLKRGQDCPVWREIAASRGLADMPCVCVVADVCRSELLFEMDAEVAVVAPAR